MRALFNRLRVDSITSMASISSMASFATLTVMFAFPSVPAFAAVTPLSVAVAPPVQFPPSDFTITGLRLSALFGRHRDVYGIDLGLIGNITDQSFAGVAVSGVFNKTSGDTTILGLQLAGLANLNSNKTRVIGLQAALGLNSNLAESRVIGLQLAIANNAPHTNIYGFQVGLYNKAQNVYGLQIGLINMTDNLRGLQIGLINFNSTGVFKVAPIVNFGF